MLFPLDLSYGRYLSLFNGSLEKFRSSSIKVLEPIIQTLNLNKKNKEPCKLSSNSHVLNL